MIQMLIKLIQCLLNVGLIPLQRYQMSKKIRQLSPSQKNSYKTDYVCSKAVNHLTTNTANFCSSSEILLGRCIPLTCIGQDIAKKGYHNFSTLW